MKTCSDDRRERTRLKQGIVEGISESAVPIYLVVAPFARYDIEGRKLH